MTTIPTEKPQKGLLKVFLFMLCKFGFKAFTFLMKFLKLGLAITSFAAYSWLLSWKFALLIMITLFIHESGHIWAMKKKGLKTKGIYFIPLLGGAAIADDAFPTRWAEVYIAVMGPIWGGVMAMFALEIYYLNHDPVWAAIAAWVAIVQLFNLLPINPLDGGRVMKSVAFSIHRWVGLVFMILGSTAGFIIFAQMGMIGLGLFLLFIGGIEFLSEWFSARKYSRMKKDHDETSVKTDMYLQNATTNIAELKALEEKHKDIITPDLAERCAAHRAEQFKWIQELQAQKNKLAELKPRILLLNKSGMTGKEVFLSIALYVGIIAWMFWIMFYVAHVPAAGAALQLLKG